MRYLTVVFEDFGNQAWVPDEFMDESGVRLALEQLGVSPAPGQRERHLRFALAQPLSPAQVGELARLQERGLFSRFFESDEQAEAEEADHE